MKKQQKILNWALGVLLLCVWGGVGYQIIHSAHSGDEFDSSMNGGLSKKNGPKIKIFQYTADIKDPFQFLVPVIHHGTKKDKPVKPVQIAPPKFPLRLLGIVNNNRRQTAIMESVDGTVSFLGKGDTLQGVKILEIGQNVVHYKFYRAEGELVVNPIQ
jgi:hypothetical protein